jgi:hypothetical protein
MAYEDFKDFAFEEKDDPRTSYTCDHNDEDEIDAKIEPVKGTIEPTGLELDEYYRWLEKLMNRAGFIDRLWWALRNVDTHIGQELLQSYNVQPREDGWDKLEKAKKKQKKDIERFNRVFYGDGEGYLAKKLTYQWLDDHCKKRHKRFFQEKRAKGEFYRFYDLDYAIK